VQAQEIEVSKPCDFSEALTRIKRGMPMRRKAWDKKSAYMRKTAIWIFEGKIRTQFINYVSDKAVLSASDILADDWIPFDER
jgi:hypothetical protein